MNYVHRFVEIIGKLLRELADIPDQLTEIRQSIEEQGKATRAANENHRQQEQEQWRKVEIQFTDQIGQIKANDKNQTGIQKSIKWAQWATFWAAIFYGGITVLLWLNAKNQLEMEHRSWVVFDPAYSDTMQLGADKTDVAVPFRLANIGKTPAKTIEGFVMVEELKKAEHPTFRYLLDQATPIRSGILYPGSEYAQTTVINEFTEGHKSVAVTTIKRKQFDEGTVIFNVWGRLTYFDVFGQQHFVQFCHAIAQQPSAKTRECVNYNLVDNPSEWPSLKTVLTR